MYGWEAPQRLKATDLALLKACPAAHGPPSKLPDSALKRWDSAFGAIKEWHRSDLPDDAATEAAESHMAWLDPVQRELPEELFASRRRRFSRDTHAVDPDAPFASANREDLSLEIFAALQLVVRSPEGEELVKLRGSGISTEEAIPVLIQGSPEGARLVEVMLGHDDEREPGMEPERRQQLIEELFGIWKRHPELARKGTRPGPHCLMNFCRRPARCGRYPEISGNNLARSTHRTATVSEKGLMRLKDFHRQVAWKRLHNIPEERIDRDDYLRWSIGSAFHGGMAAAVLEKDPEIAFEAAVAAAPRSEVQELQWPFERHEELARSEPHPVTYKQTEYEIGVTVPGIDVDNRDLVVERDVAVIFMARADATGRERDETPVVVEHRTGSEPEVATIIEIDRYARTEGHR